MNTLRAFQGIDTAFGVTISPSTVDFSGWPPTLTARVHRGDGSAASATLTPAWSDAIADLLAVPFPGTTSADLEAGNYFLTVSTVDSSAVLSHDNLVIYPTPAGTDPIRSLVTPSEMVGVIPEIMADLAQLDAVPWLLEAATVACENYVGRPLVLTTFDEIDYAGLSGRSRTLHLSTWPVSAFRLQANPQAGISIKGPDASTRATITIAQNSETDLGIKTLTLSRTGVADVVLTLANYTTIADLAAAVTLAGWTATTNYGTYPTSDLIAIDGPCTLGAKEAVDLYLFADDVDGYQLDGQGGSVDVAGIVPGSYWTTWSGRKHLRNAVRRIYTAGYLPVPKDLRTGCIMMAIALREAAKTSGPVLQQGMKDKYYTLSATVGIPEPVKAILDPYCDDWGIV